MSYNIINYNFDLNNFKNTNQLQAKDLHTNLFNRNNKINVNNQNQNSNNTANNFSYNFIEQKQFNNKKKNHIYNTYYSNFQSQGNQIPYKLNTLNYDSMPDYRGFNSNKIQNISNITNNILRYNPILNQISQNSIINSTTSYPIQYNSISNNITNAISSYPIQNNNVIPTNLNVNKTNNNFNTIGNKFFNNFNYNSQSNNAFFSNNLYKKNYSSYDYRLKDNERKKKEEYSDILKKQIEENIKRKFLEKQKQLEEDLKYEQKYRDYVRQQELEKIFKKIDLNSNLSYNIKKLNLPKTIYNSNNNKKLTSTNAGDFINSFNKNNNSIYFNNNISNSPHINNINSKAININNNNINFFMFDRNQNKRPITSPITSSIAQNGLGIINNINYNINQINLNDKMKKNSIDKISFPFISNKNNNIFNNNINELKTQHKNYSRANSYNIKKSKGKKKNEFKIKEYSNIYSILDKINFNGITYRSKYEKQDEIKEKRDKEESIKKKENKNNKINKPKLEITKLKNNDININNLNKNINEIKEIVSYKNIKNDNDVKNKEKNRKENINDELKEKIKEINKSFKKNIMIQSDNKNNVNDININNNINKDKEINFEDINKSYYKEDNSFLYFDNFSEINKSSNSLKNLEKKEEIKEQKNNNNNIKKDFNDKILNKSIQKNQENYEDICNVRYSDEESNNIYHNKIEKINSNSNLFEEKKMNFFEDNSSFNNTKKEKEINEEEDLVQEHSDEEDFDKISINKRLNNNDNYFNSKKDSVNFNKTNKNYLKNELINQKVKESGTLKDSYCDLLVKNMEFYRNICNSKKN